jgi:fatty acid desaturase
MEKYDPMNIQNLTRPSAPRFIGHLAIDWLTIAAGAGVYWLVPSIFGFIAASILVGIGQHRIAVLGHDAAHHSVSRNRFLNEVVGNYFCLFPLGLTLSSYREFHFSHHRDPAQGIDPEVPLRIAMGKNWAGPFTIKRGIKLWILSFFGCSLREVFTFMRHMPFGQFNERLALFSFWAMIIACSVYLSAVPLLGLWFVALVTTYFSSLRIQAWHEHSLRETNSIRTSRYSISNIFFRIVRPNNVWLHYEHHKYPFVPFYRLSEIRKILPNDKIFTFAEMIEAENRMMPVKSEKHAARIA